MRVEKCDRAVEPVAIGIEDIGGELGIAIGVGPSAPGKTTMSFDSAYFRGQAGFGLGVAHRLDIDVPAMLDASVAEGSSREWIVRAGFSVEF